MTTFYVGQRVRIKASINFPGLAGEEGEIVKRLSEPSLTPVDSPSEWLVAPDCWGSYRNPLNPKQLFGPNGDQLEPLTRLDNTTTTWDEMPCDRDGKFRGIPA